MMNAAPLSSPRLQRLLACLEDWQAWTTRDLVRGARVMAVSACVSELRQHWAEILCWQKIKGGRRRFYYRMTKGPDHG